MIYDFFLAITNDYDIAYAITGLTVGTAILFVVISPIFIGVLRNSYFIDKMSRKNKRKQKNNFDSQWTKLLENTSKNNESYEYRKEIEELKKEIARLKKEKK